MGIVDSWSGEQTLDWTLPLLPPTRPARSCEGVGAIAFGLNSECGFSPSARGQGQLLFTYVGNRRGNIFYILLSAVELSKTCSYRGSQTMDLPFCRSTLFGEG